MTKEEILGIAEGQSHALENANSLLQRFNQPVVETKHNPFDLDLPDDEYMTGRQVKGILQRFANQPQPTDHVARQLAAQGVLAAVQMQRADDWKRWPAELNAEINKLPPEYWTLDHLNTVVNIVRSRHIDELAAEKAQRLVDESHPTIRSGTGGSAGVLPNQTTLDSDTIPSEWVAKARSQGIDEAKVTEFCEMTGQTRAQFYAELVKYGKSPVISG